MSDFNNESNMTDVELALRGVPLKAISEIKGRAHKLTSTSNAIKEL
jgi:hypothetical protein